ncbi:hypothetical protein JCM11641_003185 [Rhodosporidiobolus odoratus]
MSTPAAPSASQLSNPEANYKAILDYLAKRGHHRAATALSADLDQLKATAAAGGTAPSPAPASPATASTPAAAAAQGGGKAVGLDDFAERNAPSAARAAQPGQRRRMDQSVAPGQMLADPPSWEKGYEGLRSFVENSLDIHRPELLPLLLPLFVHSYLDLVLVGYREAADQFLTRFAPDHQAAYPSLIRLLSSLRLPSHIAENESGLRWRTERYHVRLSERGWGLLLGWLQGGGLQGMSEGTEGRGRDRVLAIINERVKVDAIPGPPLPTSLTSHGLATEYNALRSGDAPPGILPTSTTTGDSTSGLPELKLGTAPLNAQLQREVQRQLKDQDGEDAPAGPSTSSATATNGGENGAEVESLTEGEEGAPLKDDTTSNLPDLIVPFPADLPPYPATFRTLDVQREVELVREARKRIKLGAEAFKPEGALIRPGAGGSGEGGAVGAVGAAFLSANGAGAGGKGSKEEDARRGVGRPSVCLFTVHDAGDSITTSLFSADSSLMACGFSESYIRLWSLSGKGLKALRVDLGGDEVGRVHDAKDFASLYSPQSPQTRKLIGHSGPVYSLSFDPLPGPSSPPRYLLSSSSDSTIRLWSLQTYTNVCVYRGHREPVWAVEWGPRGVYFASASRDRTARLWTTDRVNAVRIFAGHLSDVNCLSFHPNSLYLATGSSDRTLRLWDVQKGLCVRVFVGHRGAVMKCKVSPDGRWLASAGDDNLILLWSLSTGQRIKTFSGHTSSIHSLSFSAESSVLISGGADDTVRVWDVLTPPAAEEVEGKTEGKGRLAVVKGKIRKREREGEKEGGLRGSGEGGCPDLLATYATKRTNVLEVQFTPRNLCMAAGVMRDGQQ